MHREGSLSHIVQISDMLNDVSRMDHFCFADATTTPVGSFQTDPRMFLYEAYFVLLPTMYFQCAVCGQACLGQGSLGDG